MTESSNKTIGSWDFKDDNLNVIVGIVEDNSSYGTVLSEGVSCQARHEEEFFVEEDKDELLQQEEFINSFLNEGSNSNGDEAVMLHVMEPDTGEDKEEMAYLSSQNKTIRQTPRAVKEVENHNFILIKDDEAVSQGDWTCDKEEDSEDCTEFLEEITSDMEDLWHELSLLESKLVSQRMNILNVQLKLDEGEANVSHAKEESILELKGVELVTKISQIIEGRQWHVAKKEEEESYAEIEEKQLDIAQGDAYKSLKEVWVVAISGTIFTAISTVVSGAISRTKTEVKAKEI
jgi:hypothetical protein